MNMYTKQDINNAWFLLATPILAAFAFDRPFYVSSIDFGVGHNQPGAIRRRALICTYIWLMVKELIGEQGNYLIRILCIKRNDAILASPNQIEGVFHSQNDSLVKIRICWVRCSNVINNIVCMRSVCVHRNYIFREWIIRSLSTWKVKLLSTTLPKHIDFVSDTNMNAFNVYRTPANFRRISTQQIMHKSHFGHAHIKSAFPLKKKCSLTSRSHGA